MSIYSDVFDGVVAWTNRADLVTETDTAIRQAVRAAHRAGSFYRDMTTVALTGQALTQVQSIDLSSAAADLRKIATVNPTGYDVQYSEVSALDLFDQDAYPRTDVFYMIGQTLNIRASTPVDAITISYFKHPVIAPIASMTSWIAQIHQDYIICAAAATVLSMLGEQEIKTRVETLAAMGRANLIAESLFVTGH